MKKVLLALLVMGGGLMLNAGEMNVVLKALVQVESHGDVNAVGDHGTAWGCLQIRQQCLDDVNRFEAIHAKNEHRKARFFTKKDCFNRTSSIEIAKIYLTYWAKHYEKTTGKKATARIVALIWNAGPYNACKIMLTQEYWRRASIELAKLGYNSLTTITV